MSYTRSNFFQQEISSTQNSYSVHDKYRTNPQSHIQGGSVVKVIYEDGSARIYDKIKNTDAYTRFILNNTTRAIKDVVVL